MTLLHTMEYISYTECGWKTCPRRICHFCEVTTGDKSINCLDKSSIVMINANLFATGND